MQITSRLIIALLCVINIVHATPLHADQDCEPEWETAIFDDAAPNGQVHASATWDDGTGEALYIAGEFTSIGGQAVNRIARWDGTAWSPLGFGTDGPVYALAVFDDGTGPALYAGGSFTRAGTTPGGVFAFSIAKWDGASWSPLIGPFGNGVAQASERVNALAVFDDGSGPALYVGGSFELAGGLIANNIAKWDGTDWSPLPGVSAIGTQNTVLTLAVFDDGNGEALYVGGAFAFAGGISADFIARWDGSAWSSLAGGFVAGFVRALTVYDDGNGHALIAGGSFTSAIGGVTVSRMAKWNGSAWTPLIGPQGEGSNNRVDALFVHDDGSGPALYAGGDFSTAGGIAASHIARWDGSEWSPLSGPQGNGVNDRVNTMSVYDTGDGPALYAAGQFNTAGGIVIDYIARWNTEKWSRITPGGFNNTVNAMTPFDDGDGPALYAAGLFTEAGGQSISYIARLEQGAWSPLLGPANLGLDARVFALAEFDDGSGPALYAGGSFINAGGQTANRTARWDGAQWSPLAGPNGTGVNTTVDALAVYDDGSGPALYAAGNFITAGGVTVNRIARWDGSAWSALTGPGTGVNDRVFALAVYDDGGGSALYAAGDFVTAGGVPANRIARWNGAVWQALPDGIGINNRVQALAVFDDGSGPALYAGGTFTTAGGLSANRIARWNGVAWSPLSSGVSGTVVDLQVFDDGSGPALYAGGLFVTAGGVTVNRIAKWDGIAWSPLSGANGTGVNSTIGALTVFDDGNSRALYAGGNFTTAGGENAASIAKWIGCGVSHPPVCLGDIADDFGFTTADGGGPDGVVDFGDFVALLGLIGPCDGGTPGCLGDIADDFGFTASEGGGPDGVVDFGDFVALLGLIGPCP